VEAVRHDLEEALRAGLIGFQELVIGARATSQSSPLLQVGGLRRPQQPVYRRLCAAADVPPGTMQAINVDGRAILLANVETGQVCRVAHARTFAGTTSGTRWGYWSETHVVVSPTATRVLFNSDWMNGPTVDAYVVDLRKRRR